ncbi:hypothetical protein BHE74_00055863 [Ensete ventricosum]|nr:hypothetical protein BHE74_00055863 [Ensete ventricosum]
MRTVASTWLLPSQPLPVRGRRWNAAVACARPPAHCCCICSLYPSMAVTGCGLYPRVAATSDGCDGFVLVTFAEVLFRFGQCRRGGKAGAPGKGRSGSAIYLVLNPYSSFLIRVSSWLVLQIRGHEVAITELEHLQPSRVRSSSFFPLGDVSFLALRKIWVYLPRIRSIC